MQVPPQLRPFTVSFLCEEEPPPPRSTPWGAYRSQGCHIMVTQLVQLSYSECTYSSTCHHCQVPILHLSEVRQAWSSHLAQGCYMVSQLAALRFEPMTSAFRVPRTIHSATMSPQVLFFVYLASFSWFGESAYAIIDCPSVCLYPFLWPYFQLHWHLNGLYIGILPPWYASGNLGIWHKCGIWGAYLILVHIL